MKSNFGLKHGVAGIVLGFKIQIIHWKSFLIRALLERGKIVMRNERKFRSFGIGIIGWKVGRDVRNKIEQNFEENKSNFWS